MQKCLLALASVTFAAVVLSGPADGAEKLTVVLAQNTIGPNEAFNAYIPKHLGFFQEEGLDVEFQTSAGGTQVIQLVTGGRALIGLVSVPSLIIAKQKGVPIVAVYNYQRKHATAIAVAANGPIKNPRDLRGKRIGVFSMTSMRTFDGKAMVKAAGLDPDKDVTWLPVGIGAQAASALSRGEVDALSLWDSTYVDIENLGFALTYFTFPFQKDLFGLSYIATQQTVAAQPDVLVRFLRAVAKGTVFAQSSLQAAVCVYFEATGDLRTASDRQRSVRNASKVVQANLVNSELPSPSSLHGSYPSAEGWKSNEKYYREIGILDRELPPSEYFLADAKFYEAINNFDRQAIAAKAHSYTCRAF